MSYKIGWCFLCWVSENNPNQMQKNSSQCHCEWEHWYMVVIWQFLVSIINNSVVSKLTRWVWKGGSLGWGWHPPKTLSLVCVFGIDLQLWWKHISAVLLGWKCHTVCFCEGGTIKVLLLCPIWWTLKTTVPVMPVQKDYVKCIIAQSSAEQSSITWISSFFFFYKFPFCITSSSAAMLHLGLSAMFNFSWMWLIPQSWSSMTCYLSRSVLSKFAPPCDTLL